MRVTSNDVLAAISGLRLMNNAWNTTQVRKTGEGGIRTLGTLLGYGALAKRCFRPLSHLTKRIAREYDE